jgi:hypothetical protein
LFVVARSNIANDGLTPVIDVDMLDADVLVTAVPEAAQDVAIPEVR